VTVTAQQVFSELLGQLAGKNPASSIVVATATGANDFETLMTASPARYASRDGDQVPQVVPPDQVVSDSEFLPPYSTVPLQDVFPDLTDTAVRALVEHDRPVQNEVPGPPVGHQRMAERAAAEPGRDVQPRQGFRRVFGVVGSADANLLPRDRLGR
jgi:hypothetical protein